ncbi:hypothetical protein PVA45_03910 [Entomospira entomophila]|uniref:Uncharacterized protein n=1 Tax=Entomospira entomophila TaxID=2719988 RepID=A0A968G9T5_9SPIO|nr:hypothetical protein [Entomospira entomophilus]NIZ40656.1 hypothetical protein [Entomospira entomophilus]WDI34870.1 hypothetical protein PVA45_03910 [Entomospira entomophilus]
MYYIHVILYGYKQLQQIDAPLISEIEEKMVSTMLHHGGLLKDGYPYTIELPSSYQESGLVAIESAFELHAIFRSIREKLIGYNILITEESDLQIGLYRLLNFVTDDDHIWVDRSSLVSLSFYVESIEMPGIALATEIKANSWTVQSVRHEWLYQAKIESILKKYRYGLHGKKVVLFYGQHGEGKRYSIEQVIEKTLQGHIHKEFSFAVIDSHTERYDMVDPFRGLFSPFLVSEVKSVIRSDEVILFEQLTGFISYLLSKQVEYTLDKIGSDLLLFAKFYFRIYKQYCQEHRLPVWVFAYYTRNLQTHTRKILNHLLEILHNYGIMVIAVEESVRFFAPYEVEAYLIKSEELFYHQNVGIITHDGEIGCEKVTAYEVLLIEWLLSKSKEVRSTQLEKLVYSVLSEMDALLHRVLFQVALADGMLSLQEVISSLEIDSQGERLAYKRARILEKLRLITHRHTKPYIMFSFLLEISFQLIGSRAGEYIQSFYAYLIRRKTKVSSWFFVHILSKIDVLDRMLVHFDEHLNHLIDARRIDFHVYLQKNILAGKNADRRQLAACKTIIHTAQLRALMLKNQYFAESELLIDDLPYVEPSSEPFVNYYLLQKVRREGLNRYSKRDNSIDQLKKLAYAFQKSADHIGEALVNYELSYAMFQRGSIKQALDFCDIALRLFETCHFLYGELLSLTLRAVITFTYGQYSITMQYAKDGEKRALMVGNHEHWHVLRFLQSRVDMELGRYTDAQDRMSEDLSIAEQYGRTDIVAVLQNWILWSYILAEETEKVDLYKENITPNLETSYFLAHFYHLQGEYGKMVEVLSVTYSMQRVEHGISSEEVEWIDGFHIIDGRRYYNHSMNLVLRELADELYDYAQSQCQEVSKEEQESALERLRSACSLNIVQVERPYDYITPYLYAKSIKQSNPEEFSIAINRSLRIALSYSNRIIDIETKNAYLSRNFWIQQIQRLKRDSNS